MKRRAARNASLLAVLCGCLFSAGVGQKQTERDQLIGRLGSDDWWVRELSAEELAGFGAEGRDAIPALIVALQDETEGVRRMAAYALGRIGGDSDEAQAALVDALADPDYGVRYKAIGAVAGFGVTVIPALMELFDSDYADTTQVGSAVAALARMGAPAVPSLRQGLEAGGDRASYSARALRFMGPAAESAGPALVEALGSQDEQVRRYAAAALGAIGSPVAELAMPALIRALQDAGLLVGSEAAVALGKMGPRAQDAVPALERALESPNRYTREGAQLALRKIRKE